MKPLVSEGAAMVAAIIAALFVGLAPAALAERILEFDVEVSIQEDATFTVEEQIVYDFGSESRHGIYRDIPIRYGRGAAADYRIDLDVESVTDRDGRARPFRLSRDGANQRIRIGDPYRKVSGRQEYLIRYRVRRGLLWFDDHDEFYWNATGTEWPVAIDEASVSIELPRPVADGVEALCFTGHAGSVETACSTRVIPTNVRAESHRGFGREEGLTVVVSLPKGVIAEPSDVQKFIDRASDFVSLKLLLPIAIFLAFWAWWKKAGADPEVGASVAVRYEPPEGMSPAEMGTVVDEQVDMIDITATILDLAVRGYLQIEESETSKFVFFSTTHYTLHRSTKDELELKPHESKLLQGLFGESSSVQLSELKNEFYTRLPGIREALYSEVSTDGHWFPARPDRVRSLYKGVTIGLTVVGGIVAMAVQSEGWLLSALACGGVGYFWSRIMPRRTRRGREALQHILGFQEFIVRVDKDRLERQGLLEASQFERLLPYAFVLGVADEWAEVFADIYHEPPSWYVGPHAGAFRPRVFVSHVGRSLETAGTAMQSRPSRGSGSSGFSSGGGFSGGGFGGGGGGSW